MVVEIALLIAKAGSADELRNALRVARAVIATAPGYLSSVFHQGIEEPESFILRIEWESLEAHLLFRETPLLGEWRAPFFHLLAGPPKVTHYQTIAGPAH
jgi:heme-degrading monooxygenase HmoA